MQVQELQELFDEANTVYAYANMADMPDHVKYWNLIEALCDLVGIDMPLRIGEPLVLGLPLEDLVEF